MIDLRSDERYLTHWGRQMIALLLTSILAMALAAAIVGIQTTLQYSSAQTPPRRQLAGIAAVSAVLVFPAMFITAKCLPYFAGKAANEAQAGVAVLAIGLGCSGLVSVVLTAVLIARGR